MIDVALKRARKKQGRDRRTLALVLAGFSLLAPHILAPLTSLYSVPIRSSFSDRPFMWLGATDALPEGLYQLEITEEHESRSNGPLQNVKNGNSQSTEIPAHVAPILFLPIPINKASRETLMVIPGIGNTLANAIMRYRDREGRIKDKSALMKTEGIGKKKADSIAEHVVFDK